MRLRNAWLVMVLALLVLAGCSSSPGRPDPSTLPDGAIGLTQNQPSGSTVDGRYVIIIAASIDESGALLSIGAPPGDKPATVEWVNIDDTIEFDGVTLRLVATWVNPEPPGKGDSARKSLAWVVAETDGVSSPPADGTPPEDE